MMLIQGIYAIFAAQVAKRTQRSVPLFAILTLIPVFGMLFFIYVIWSTTLYVLDSLNELKAKP
ncbi:hypothetical protein [Comamonas terrigena]|uniref:hypothetical protein n=1 Tax=Comamonas terrigena TaxID=32013 RepID=UPI00289F9D8F|nr:hypothetical protein [Comamonas terrigena]